MFGLHSLLSEIVLLMTARWRDKRNIKRHVAQSKRSLALLSCLDNQNACSNVCVSRQEEADFILHKPRVVPRTIPCFDVSSYNNKLHSIKDSLIIKKDFLSTISSLYFM